MQQHKWQHMLLDSCLGPAMQHPKRTSRYTTTTKKNSFHNQGKKKKLSEKSVFKLGSSSTASRVLIVTAPDHHVHLLSNTFFLPCSSRQIITSFARHNGQKVEMTPSFKSATPAPWRTGKDGSVESIWTCISWKLCAGFNHAGHPHAKGSKANNSLGIFRDALNRHFYQIYIFAMLWL